MEDSCNLYSEIQLFRTEEKVILFGSWPVKSNPRTLIIDRKTHKISFGMIGKDSSGFRDFTNAQPLCVSHKFNYIIFLFCYSFLKCLFFSRRNQKLKRWIWNYFWSDWNDTTCFWYVTLQMIIFHSDCHKAEFVNICLGCYLVTVKERTLVGMIDGHYIYKLMQPAFCLVEPPSNNTSSSGESQVCLSSFKFWNRQFDCDCVLNFIFRSDRIGLFWICWAVCWSQKIFTLVTHSILQIHSRDKKYHLPNDNLSGWKYFFVSFSLIFVSEQLFSFSRLWFRLYSFLW
jgi:hypothetical protein